jgi:hypothetical protein
VAAQEEGGWAGRTTCGRSKALITKMLGTKCLLKERRKIAL